MILKSKRAIHKMQVCLSIKCSDQESECAEEMEEMEMRRGLQEEPGLTEGRQDRA